MKKIELVSLIYSVIDIVNELLHDEQKLSKSEETKLYGTSGELDSHGMVNFIVTLEHQINETLGVSVILINETTMSQENSPFETVGSLADYICHLLNENRSC
tara:strand:- start:5437 stop:5742 length:306 start_codon:yes stop_codon:yes gene_type:complete